MKLTKTQQRILLLADRMVATLNQGKQTSRQLTFFNKAYEEFTSLVTFTDRMCVQDVSITIDKTVLSWEEFKTQVKQGNLVVA